MYSLLLHVSDTTENCKKKELCKITGQIKYIFMVTVVSDAGVYPATKGSSVPTPALVFTVSVC